MNKTRLSVRVLISLWLVFILYEIFAWHGARMDVYLIIRLGCLFFIIWYEREMTDLMRFFFIACEFYAFIILCYGIVMTKIVTISFIACEVCGFIIPCYTVLKTVASSKQD